MVEQKFELVVEQMFELVVEHMFELVVVHMFELEEKRYRRLGIELVGLVQYKLVVGLEQPKLK